MTKPTVSAAYERLFDALDPKLQALAARGIIRTYPKNALIAREGEPGDCIFVLLQGRVKVYSSDSAGREITHGVAENGDVFDEASLDGGPRPASAMTLEPSICSIVTRNTLHEHVVREPEVAMEFVTRLARRARAATETARSMALLDVYGRMVNVLERRFGPASPMRPIALMQITHQEIASHVGASREMVSRLLKDLEKGGYLELGVKRITLLKKLPARW